MALLGFSLLMLLYVYIVHSPQSGAPIQGMTSGYYTGRCLHKARPLLRTDLSALFQDQEAAPSVIPFSCAPEQPSGSASSQGHIRAQERQVRPVRMSPNLATSGEVRFKLVLRSSDRGRSWMLCELYYRSRPSGRLSQPALHFVC